MKKILLFASALAGLFLAGSCQKETLEPAAQGGVTYEITLPDGPQTKGENGYDVYDLHYEVYKTADANALATTPLLFEKTVTMTGNTTTVTLDLLNDQDYTVLFWANKQGTDYFDLTDLRKVGVKQASANNDDRDAFCGKDQLVQHDGAQSKTVELKRPFAQINIATLVNNVDYDINPVSSLVKVSVPVKYNVFTGEPVGELDDVEYTVNTVPTGYLTVNGTDYKKVAMNYALVPATQDNSATVDVYYEINTNNGTVKNTIPNVPVKKNYRTNIIGNLLTSNATYNVVLLPGFEEGAYVGPEFVKEPAYNAETKTWTVTNADELAWVAASVNGTIGLQTKAGTATKSFKGETVELANDIDLQGTEWEPIGINSTSYFQGTFDGKNYTISNFKVTEKAGHAGLFGYARATIKNLKVNNVTLKANHYAGAIVGQGYCRIDNCDAENVNIIVTIDPAADGGKGDLGDKAGAIIGQNCEGALYVTNCTAKDVIIEGYRDLGGILGMAHNNNVVTGNSVENVTIIQNLENAYKTDVPTTLGAIAGRWGSNVTQNNNSGNANIKKALAAGVYASETETDSEGNTTVTEYSVYAAEGLEWIAANVNDETDGFEGKTVKLVADIDLFKGYMPDGDPITTAPIGDKKVNGENTAFKGTFDGQNHAIKNLYQNGWALNYEWGVYGSLGLFRELEGATVKNVVIEGMDALVEGGDISFIAGSATGDCVFENITVKNSSIGTYNNGCGGIIGWSGAGNYTFKNITIGEDVVLGGLWGSFDSSIGGIVGQAEPGATYNFENVTINCRIDAYNDCTASYDYYNYRMCGMIIGRCEETTTINGANYPDLSKYNLSFNNVVVNYGDWMNYHYCRRSGERAVRVEPGYAYDGIAADRNHSTDDKHCMECIPFNQLIGGDQYAVKGLPEVDGVTVNYPASYRRGVSSAASMTEALNKGLSVVLEGDIDFGSTQLAITGENQVVDLGGHALTTANNWGGISLKNGATIKNGTITHAGNTAAIKAFNGSSVENVTINATCATADKTVTGIAVQQGATVESIKNVTINGVSQGIEVGYQATVGLIENAVVNESNNGTAKGIGLVINGGKVGLAKDCTFKGETYGITLHLKGVFDAGLELENCTVEGTTASIYAWDEKGISNTSGSLVLTYDAATTLTGPFVWDFEEECQSVVTLNRPQ